MKCTLLHSSFARGVLNAHIKQKLCQITGWISSLCSYKSSLNLILPSSCQNTEKQQVVVTPLLFILTHLLFYSSQWIPGVPTHTLVVLSGRTRQTVICLLSFWNTVRGLATQSCLLGIHLFHQKEFYHHSSWYGESSSCVSEFNYEMPWMPGAETEEHSELDKEQSKLNKTAVSTAEVLEYFGFISIRSAKSSLLLFSEAKKINKSEDPNSPSWISTFLSYKTWNIVLASVDPSSPQKHGGQAVSSGETSAICRASQG